MFKSIRNHAMYVCCTNCCMNLDNSCQNQMPNPIGNNNKKKMSIPCHSDTLGNLIVNPFTTQLIQIVLVEMFSLIFAIRYSISILQVLRTSGTILFFFTIAHKNKRNNINNNWRKRKKVYQIVSQKKKRKDEKNDR